MRRSPALALAALGLIPLACGESTPAADSEVSAAPPAADDGVIDPGDQGDYAVTIDPAEFSQVIDNPYLPLAPGTRWVYEERSPDGEVEVITVEVLGETRAVMGVETVVVHDQVTTDEGDLVEDTFDWYAQDADGNVWYFGEDTKAYDDGSVSDEGAWEAGVDGALPGIVMPSSPTVSETGYRQEFQADQAEDMGQVVDVARGVVVTRDWTPLEPDVIEEKTYVSGIGLAHEQTTAGEGAGTTTTLTEFSIG